MLTPKLETTVSCGATNAPHGRAAPPKNTASGAASPRIRVKRTADVSDRRTLSRWCSDVRRAHCPVRQSLRGPDARIFHFTLRDPAPRGARDRCPTSRARTSVRYGEQGRGDLGERKNLKDQ